VDLHQENAGYLDLVAVASTCVAESGEQHLVHFSRTGRVILRAKRDALLGLPKTWRKRQYIQKIRITSIDEVWLQLDKRLITIKLG